MTPTERMLLDIFRAFNVGAGEVLLTPSVQSHVMRWPQAHSTGYAQAAQGLATQGYVDLIPQPPPGALRLTQKGETDLYGTPTLQHVESLILAMFRRFNTAPGHMLIFNSIHGHTEKWTPPERRLYAQAVQSLVAAGRVQQLSRPVPGSLLFVK